MSRKIVVQAASRAWSSLAWSLVIIGLFIVALAVSACKPMPAHGTDPCRAGCKVPDGTGPQRVPLCQDAAGRGPCVGQVGDSGMWIYTPRGAMWPDGAAVDLCPTEDGGPAACAWVPSVQYNRSGAAGALVYGVTA
jgi:hypothetical protein